MVTCADTSFLFSLYGNDSNTPRALKWLHTNPCVTPKRLLHRAGITPCPEH